MWLLTARNYSLPKSINLPIAFRFNWSGIFKNRARSVLLLILTESGIREYAQFHKLEATTAGLAMMYSLPVDVIERALVDPNRELILILARAANFSWETAMALLFLGAHNHQISASDLEQHHNNFYQLSVDTAQSVLQAYRLRKSVPSDSSDQRRLPELHAR